MAENVRRAVVSVELPPDQFYSKKLRSGREVGPPQPAESSSAAATEVRSKHSDATFKVKTDSAVTEVKAMSHLPIQPKNIVQALSMDSLRTCTTSKSNFFTKSYLDSHLRECDKMYSTDIVGHHGCVNALTFSKRDEQFLATGGDDQRVLVWRVAEAIQNPDKLTPLSMSTNHRSNIFTMDFSCDNAFIFSGGEDRDLIKHDFRTGQFVSSYEHLQAVYSVACHPGSPEVVLTASEDGCVYIIDTRLPRRELGQDMLLCEDLDSFQCVAINPVEHRLVAVSSASQGSSLYDTRNRKLVVSYRGTSYPVFHEDGVSVCFNSTGTHVFSMYRRHAPTLHALWEPRPLCFYTDLNGSYRNSVTMKSGCFMGENDEYVVSGSDDFRVYIWKVPTDTGKWKQPEQLREDSDGGFLGSLPLWHNDAHLVLPGHRSIVNQTRYSKVHRILASSGVEKIVKSGRLVKGLAGTKFHGVSVTKQAVVDLMALMKQARPDIPVKIEDTCTGKDLLWSDCRLNKKNSVHKTRDLPPRRRYTQIELDSMMANSDPTDPTEEDQKVLALFDSLVEEDMNGGRDSDSSSDWSDGPRGWLPFYFDSDSTPSELDLSMSDSSSLFSEPLRIGFDFGGFNDNLEDAYGSDADDWYSSSNSDDLWNDRSSRESSRDRSEVGAEGRENSARETGGAMAGNESEEVKRKEEGVAGSEEKNGEEMEMSNDRENTERGEGSSNKNGGSKTEGEEKLLSVAQGTRTKAKETGNEERGSRNEERGSRNEERGSGNEGKGGSQRKGKRKMESSSGDKEDCCRQSARKKEKLESAMNGLEVSNHCSPAESRTAERGATVSSKVNSSKVDVKVSNPNGDTSSSNTNNSSSSSAQQNEPSSSSLRNKGSQGGGKSRRGKGKAKAKTDSTTAEASTSQAGGSGESNQGACGTGPGLSEEATTAAASGGGVSTRTKSKRQRLMQLQSGSGGDFSAYNADSFLKAKPASHFYSPANQIGNSSKE